MTDAAGAISTTVDSFPLTGTLVGSALTLSGACGPPCVFVATVFPGEDYFDGKFQVGFVPTARRVLGNRCECFDGNTSNGDGCDATCRVEACFTCTGMPSSCSPTSDGGSCSDHSACTSGETCTAGVCSGSPVVPCVDLSGLWDTTVDYDIASFDRPVQIEQWEGFALIRNHGTGYAEHFGTIVPGTGVFLLEDPELAALCTFQNADPLSGTASLDGLSFTASGVDTLVSMATCGPLPYTQTGTRADAAPVPALGPVAGMVLVALLLLATAATLRNQRDASLE